MTVSSTFTPTRINGNGATVDFAFTYKVFETSDVRVILVTIADGTETLQVETTDYTIALNPTTDGGTITFLTAPPATDQVFADRVVPNSQPFNVPINDKLPEEQVENAYDRAVMVSQQNSEEIKKSLKLPISSTLEDVSIPVPIAGRGLVWNVTEDGFDNTVNDLDTAETNAAASAAAALVSEGNAAASAAASAADVVTTNADVVLTNADVVSTGNDVTSSAASALAAANSAESIGFKWAFDTSTVMADPGASDFRLNNATIASATAIAISDTSNDTGTPDVSTFVLSWDDSLNLTNRGSLILRKISAPEDFAIFTISGASTDNTGWTELAVTYVTGNGTFSSTDDIIMTFSRSGDTSSVTVDDVTIEDVGGLRVKDNGISLAKLAGGTAGNLITYDASGDPAAVATGTAAQVLTSNGAGAAPTFQTPTGGGGKVLQVVESSFTASTQTTTSSTYIDITGSSSSITPTSASSTIRASIWFTGSTAGVSGGTLGLRLIRTSTTVNTSTSTLRGISATTAYAQVSHSFTDSPATTSATTYKWAFANSPAGGTAGIHNVTATIRLEEIGA